ncbi:MAG: chloride channel protein [Conexibacteraceae bacterium]|nr:chloride channel protein [Conexibacteraceae bacterium]
MSGAGPDQDRWSSPQGNVTGLGIIASYGARFWTLVIGLGVITGLAAAGLVGLLRLVERISYGVDSPTLLAAVEASAPWRRPVVLLVAALIVIVGLRVLGRASTGGTEVTEAIWLRSGRLAFFPSLARGVLSIVIVGMGVSLGREAAPQLAGGAFASRAAEWLAVPVWQRRLLVAAGAGAGFAAVYNVPLGGMLLTAEVMLGTLALPIVLPTMLMCATATAVAWIFLGDQTIYHITTEHFRASELVFAIVMGPIIGLVATVWARLITAANRSRPKDVGRWFAPLIAFGVLGLLALQYPQLLGNGRGIVQLGIVGNISLGLLVVLLLLKPLVTLLCVASGAPGGLFTPTFAVGVLLSGVGGALWLHIWHGGAPGAYALIGGAAFLAAAMQGPIAGVVIVLELTRNFDALIVPTVVAVVEATVLSRRLKASSIYSARMGSGDVMAASPTANAASVATILALDETLPDLTRQADEHPPETGAR